jgi:hypothetical protein
VGGPFGHANATRNKKKPALTGHTPLPSARDVSVRPVVFVSGQLSADAKRQSSRAANAMFPVKPFTEPERFYRTRDSFRPPVLPRLFSVCRGTVEARTMITPEGAYRFEFMNVCIAVFARLLHSLNGVSHPKEISAPIITISITNRIKNGRFTKHHEQKQVPRAIRLLPQAGCRARVRFRPQGRDRVRRGASITFFPRRRTRSPSDLGRLACIFRFARLHRSAGSKPAFLGPVLLSINCH